MSSLIGLIKGKGFFELLVQQSISQPNDRAL